MDADHVAKGVDDVKNELERILYKYSYKYRLLFKEKI